MKTMITESHILSVDEVNKIVVTFRQSNVLRGRWRIIIDLRTLRKSSDFPEKLEPIYDMQFEDTSLNNPFIDSESKEDKNEPLRNCFKQN